MDRQAPRAVGVKEGAQLGRTPAKRGMSTSAGCRGTSQPSLSVAVRLRPAGPDPRPHIAVLPELIAFGWLVTEIRPDRTEPGDVARHDQALRRFVSVTTTGVDPDAALDKLKRYASVDRPTTTPARRSREQRAEDLAS